MSILHVSINAQAPERVARFLARILDGEATRFPPFPGCWIAFSERDDGTAIEVYPATHALIAGREQLACEISEPDVEPTFVHIAVASAMSRRNVIELAWNEGWTARVCNRGPFVCVEVWLENRLLIEVLDPSMQERYRQGMTIENWKKMFDLP